MGDMGSLHWLAQNWFTLLNAIGVVGGLLFTGHSLRSETKTRRIANLLSHGARGTETSIGRAG